MVGCVVRARFDGERIADCAVGLGGVATVPLRMDPAESILTGASLSDEIIDQAARACTEGASPLAEPGYKVDLVAATVRGNAPRPRSGSCLCVGFARAGGVEPDGMTAPSHTPVSPQASATTGGVRALLDERTAGLPVWVVVTQVFLGLGWLRAAAEKLISGGWWRGEAIEAFLAEHEAQTLGWYQPSRLE